MGRSGKHTFDLLSGYYSSDKPPHPIASTGTHLQYTPSHLRIAFISLLRRWYPTIAAIPSRWPYGFKTKLNLSLWQIHVNERTPHLNKQLHYWTFGHPCKSNIKTLTLEIVSSTEKKRTKTLDRLSSYHSAFVSRLCCFAIHKVIKAKLYLTQYAH